MATQSVIITSTNYAQLPETEAVYAIYAQEKDTSKPINCRYVGQTDNLRRRTGEHFSPDEPNECLREFMQSTKTKILVYELMPGSTEDERRAVEEAWIKELNPKCNKPD